MQNNAANKIKLFPYYVAYMDLLGISDAIKSEDSEDYLNKIYNLFDDVNKAVSHTNQNHQRIKVIKKIFSDNIIIAIKKEPFFQDITEEIKQYLLVEIVSYLQLLGLKYFFLIRGGITIGDLYINNDFVYGKGLLESYKLESQNAIFPRIIISENCMDEFIQNNNIRTYLKKDFDGTCYVDSFTAYFDLLNDYKNNIKNEMKYIQDFLLSQITNNDDYKIIQKKYWIINKFNDFCQNKGFEEYLIDTSKYPYNPNYIKTTITGNASKFI